MTKAEKLQVIAILDQFDDYIPRNYVNDVQRLLIQKGIIRSVNQIVTTRNRRSYHLDIAQALKEISVFPEEEQLDNTRKSIIENLSLVKE